MDLLTQPDNICQMGAQRFSGQMNGDQMNKGARFLETNDPNLWGGSWQLTDGSWANWTGLTQKAFDNGMYEFKKDDHTRECGPSDIWLYS